MAEALPPVDESVAIPPAVKAAAERAEAFYKQEPEQKAAEPEPRAASPEPEAPAPTPASEPEPPTDKVAELEAQLAKRERDYNALLGRNAQQREYIAMQQTQLQNMSNPRSWAQPQQQQPAQPQPPLITEAERQAYGEEALSVMERKAREVVRPVVQDMERQNQQLRNELQRVKSQDVYDALDQHLQNWRQINGEQQWKDWLTLPDLYSGVIRQRLLDQAFAAGDAGRVLAFFRGFQSEYPEHMGQQAQQPPEAPPSQTPVRKAAVKLESLAAPGRASPSPSSAAMADVPLITNKDVSRFYWDVTHGRYAGREQDKLAREAQIHAAVRDGRVQIVK
jgi:hypothetical protein